MKVKPFSAFNPGMSLKRSLKNAILYEKSGQYGFLLQELVPSKGRSLRVVVIHQTVISYWRVQEDADGFYTNLTKGAKIDTDVGSGPAGSGHRCHPEIL